MSQYDEYDDLPQQKQRKSKSKQRKKSPTKAPDAEKLKQQLDVLQRPLVFWSGEAPDELFEVNGKPFWTIHYGLSQRLEKKPSGIYSVTENSEGFEYKRIDRSTLTRLQKLFNEANKHRDVLRKQIHHIGTLISDTEQKLRMLDHIFIALDAYRQKKPEALVLEAMCIWIGREKKRPSSWLKTQAIEKWLQQKGDAKLPGKRLAAVVLGKRDHDCKLHDSHITWWRYGRLLNHWPAGIVALLKGGNQIRLHKLLARCPQINSKPAVLAVFDYLWMKPKGDLIELLEALPVVLDAFQKCIKHTEKCKNQFLEFLQTSMQYPIANKIMPQNYWIGIDSAFLEALKAQLSIHLHHENKSLDFEVDPFMATSIYFLGIQPDAKWKRRLSKFGSKTLEELEQRFLNEVESKILKFIKKPDRTLESFACSIFGTFSAKTDPKKAALGIAEWLETSCKHWAPGISGQRHIEYALFHLMHWMYESNYDEDNITRLSEILTTFSELIYSEDQRKIFDQLKQPPKRFNFDRKRATLTLSKIGLLNSDECKLIIENELIEEVNYFLKADKHKLKAAIEILNQPKRQWLLTWWKEWSYDRVHVIFSKRPNLVNIIINWCDKHRHLGGFNDEETSELFEVLTDWCISTNDHPDYLECAGFLEKHPWFLKQLSITAKYYQGLINQPGGEKWLDIERALNPFDVLVKIGIELENNGWENLPATVQKLFEHFQERDKVAAQKNRKREELYNCEYSEIPMMVALCNQNVEQLLRLIKFESETLRYNEECKNGFAILEFYSQIKEFLAQALGRAELTNRIFRLLTRIAIALRFQSRDYLRKKFTEWENPTAELATIDFKLPKIIQQDCQKLIHWRLLADKSDSLPKTVQRIINRPLTLEKEYQFLCKKNKLSNQAQARKENLEHYLEDSKEMQRWIAADLQEELKKQTHQTKLEALECIVQNAIQQHWIKTLGSIETTVDMNSHDWDNALILYSNLKENRSILRRLLRSEAVGDRKWFLEHQENKKFLRKMEESGLNIIEWQKGCREKVHMKDGNWTIYTETEPLKVLQMGNLFGTCLSINDFNNFSTIANALEVNKHVIYIENPKGKIIGRKLILLTKDLKFIGCYSYGSGDSPWIKILLDLFCKKIMKAVRIKPEQLKIDADDYIEEKDISLFAKTYYDGMENWDKWIFSKGVSLKHLQSTDKSKTVWLKKYANKEEESRPFFRAILYSGEAALNYLKTLKPERFDKEDWETIQNHAKQAKLRKAGKKILGNIEESR